jgi:hypothetical protein
MSEEAVKETEEAAESAIKPTITIAERDGAAAETPEAQVASEAQSAESPKEPEDVHYQAVEKDGNVTAIWEMQGQRHLRTIDPRSSEGKQILALFETAG